MLHRCLQRHDPVSISNKQRHARGSASDEAKRVGFVLTLSREKCSLLDGAGDQRRQESRRCGRELAKMVLKCARDLLRFLRGEQKYRIVPLRKELTLRFGEIFAPGPIIRAMWDEQGELLQLVGPETVDSLLFYEFRDMIVSPNRRGGFFLKDKEALIPRNGLPGIPRIFFSGTKVGRVTAQAGELLWVRNPRQTTFVPRAVFAGSMAPHNWFHWTIDNLPNLLAALRLPAEYSEWPILIPKVALERESWLKSLRLVIGNRPYLAVEPNDLYRVGELVVLDGVTRPAPRVLASSVPGRIGIHQHGLRHFKEYVAAKAAADRSRGSIRRVFLMRDDGDVRSYNQDEILAIAERFGFQAVSLRGVSLSDSVAIFSGAEAIAGPHGAGWAGLLFAEPETKALFWSWGGEIEDNWYENIAYVSEVNFAKISYSVAGQNGVSKSSQDERDLDYFLNPAVFESALTRLMST